MTATNVLCIGDLLVDIWWDVDTAVRNVEHAAMALVSLPEDKEVTPGGVGIVSSAMVELGLRAAVLTVVDDQPDTAVMVRSLANAGVDVNLIHSSTYFVTPVKTRYININGHILMRHDSEAAQQDDTHAPTVDYLRQNLRKFDCLAVSDYRKGGIRADVRAQLIAVAQEADKPVYVDAKPAYFKKYAKADVFKINMAEFQNFAPEELRGRIEAAVPHVAKQLETPLLIVTAGSDGAYYSHNYGVTNFMPNPARHAAGNCVGAGDVFFAGVVFGFSQLGKYRPAELDETEIFKVVQFGIAAASEYVKLGSRAFPTPPAVLNAVSPRSAPVRRIMQPEQLIAFARKQRKAGKQIVFTNGCFDLLHSGHVELLTAAKREGDVLLVAVDADSNVSRLKGPDRPVHDAAIRAGNVAALDVVDAVCIFEDYESNVLLKYLIAEIQPDALVKGADYADKPIVGAKFLSRQNPPGRVVLVPLVPNSSTTAFVNKIKAMTP
jgi:D-beta-D-heptose 7-phosphate kinase/D-beta-D-heptose 1-phosphate adenosyltransferase